MPPAEVPSSPRQEEQRPSQAQPIRRAIEEVSQIVLSLKTVLSEMEEVLELLEMAEVQKEVDEREIAALQQALSRLQRGHERRHSAGASPEPREPQSQPQ